MYKGVSSVAKNSDLKMYLISKDDLYYERKPVFSVQSFVETPSYNWGVYYWKHGLKIFAQHKVEYLYKVVTGTNREGSALTQCHDATSPWNLEQLCQVLGSPWLQVQWIVSESIKNVAHTQPEVTKTRYEKAKANMTYHITAWTGNLTGLTKVNLMPSSNDKNWR